MDKLVSIFDGLDSKDHARLTAFDTSIDIVNLDTGECIFKGLKNKVIIPGSGFIARKLFNITGDEVTPSYNEACGNYNINMYTPTTDTVPSNESDAKATKDNQKVLLFCCGTDGCGTENSQVYPVDYTKWISPEDLVPFRITSGSDLSSSLRKIYFGRSTINISGKQYTAYYFKRFEKDPILVQQYVDSTPITSTVYDDVKNTNAESYVEISLRITKEDMRDYFNLTTGISEAKINSISLCSGYPVEDTDGNIYYKDIRPLTKFNIPNEPLIDTTKGIAIIYHIYM